ncbi:MAG: class I SAM-dependent methyltransferase [Phycisphaerales bacterium]
MGAALGRDASFTLGGREANRYDLYEWCVQSPEMEARFLRAVHGGGARVLGEDFAGACGVARAWIGLDGDYEAVGVDRDPEPLEHAARRQSERDHRSDGPASRRAGIDRLHLRVRDVLEAGDRCDVLCALNFGVSELHRRDRLMSYLRAALFRLESGGILVVDTYGGPDAMAAGVYEKMVRLGEEWGGGAVGYEWEQVSADPATARVRNAIHFVLPDGRRMDDAFEYDWRVWSTPELREAMLEAGFRATEVYDSYAEAIDADGEPYPRAISARLDEPDDESSVEEAFVHYVVGRV